MPRPQPREDEPPAVRVPLRVAAVCMAISGVLVAATTPPHPNILTGSVSESVEGTALWTAIHLALLIAIGLAFLGVCGIVAAHRDRLGRWGQAALAASFAGSVGGAAVMGLEAIAFPILATEAPELLDLDGPLLTAPSMIGVGILLLGWPIGLTILGIAAARARLFPRGAGILLAISAPAFIALEGPFLPVLGVLSALLLGAVQVWWAWLLWGAAGAERTAYRC